MKASCNNRYFEAQLRGFCIRCLRFTNLVAKTHARLATSDLLCPSGWSAWLRPWPSLGHLERFRPIILLPRAFVSQSQILFSPDRTPSPINHFCKKPTQVFYYFSNNIKFFLNCFYSVFGNVTLFCQYKPFAPPFGHIFPFRFFQRFFREPHRNQLSVYFVFTKGF